MRLPTVILLLGVAVIATVHGDYIGDFYGEAHRAALHDAVDLIADNKDAIKDSINGLATPANDEAADDLAALKLLDAISEVESSLPDEKIRGLKNSLSGFIHRGKNWLKKNLIKGIDGIFKKKCKGKRCKNKDKKKRPRKGNKGRGQGGKRGQGGGRGNGGRPSKGGRRPKEEKTPVPIPAPVELFEEPIEQPAPEPAPGTDDVGAEEPAAGSEDYAAEEPAPGEQEAVAEQARLANRARNIYRRLKCAIRRGRSKPAWCQEYLRPPLSFDDQN